MPFFIIFLVVPLIEISLFVSVGSEIGVFWTLFLCVGTAALGAFLLRNQGLKTLFSARRSLDKNQLPVHEIFDGICLALAGVILMTPGFFTDALGFLLLTPKFRDVLLKKITHHFDFQTMGMKQNSKRPYENNNVDIIEGDFEELDEEEDKG